VCESPNRLQITTTLLLFAPPLVHGKTWLRFRNLKSQEIVFTEKEKQKVCEMFKEADVRHKRMILRPVGERHQTDWTTCASDKRLAERRCALSNAGVYGLFNVSSWRHSDRTIRWERVCLLNFYTPFLPRQICRVRNLRQGCFSPKDGQRGEVGEKFRTTAASRQNSLPNL